MRLCSVAGCSEKRRYSNGYCSKHGARFTKYGDPNIRKKRANGEGSYDKQFGYFKVTRDGKQKGEHIVVAERILGRPLKAPEIVHHINQNRLDNRNENLLICTRPYHNLIHARMRALDACGNADWMWCRYCKSYDDPKKMYVHPRNHLAHHRACVNSYQKGLLK